MAITTAPMLLSKPTPSMPLRYGLFQAAVGPRDLPVHARNGGLQYVHALCGEGFGYEIACIGDQASKADSFEAGLDTVLGAPFIVYATVTCGTVGYTSDELRSFVVERLKGVEQSVVEQVLSTGDFGQAPGLTAADGIVTVTGAGTTAVEVVSELERAMYCGFDTTVSNYGPPAYLHMAIPVFNELKSQHLIEFDGTRWRTPLGTVVSTGCYANNDPDGDPAADGTFWVYITGQTTVWRTGDSEIFVPPIEGALNRATNQVTMIAEREYVVTYECDGFAKAVTLWTA